jgi:phenylalanyl-tRNA synthetase alpha chain
VSGPLVEHDWYNFTALNMPPDHPARDMQDTFFVAPEVVLRTHTSNVQVRTLLSRPPPVRVVAPGMVFRHDEVDATHSPVFHQVEGLWVDEQVTFADLKGVLHHLVMSLFGQDVRLRFRPSYFPFTEPSCECDVSCSACGDRPRPSCRICHGGGWLEVLGAGMVDPAVMQAVGLDPERYSGFAFGLGIERICLLRHGIADMRGLFDNDLRLLQACAGLSPPAAGRRA